MLSSSVRSNCNNPYCNVGISVRKNGKFCSKILSLLLPALLLPLSKSVNPYCTVSVPTSKQKIYM